MTPALPARLPVGNVAGLTDLDVAVSGCMGYEPRTPLPRPGKGATVGGALDELLLDPLERGRCLVSFPGTRESSWILAAATRVARSRGLDDPIPITMRPRSASPGPEIALQESVVGRLGLSDWVRFGVDDELELVGAYAAATLHEHGLLFPSTAYLLQPQLERARGGTLVVTEGPSDFFSFWRSAPLAELLAGERRPRREDLKAVATAVAPTRARIAYARRAMGAKPMTWLRPGARERVLAIRSEQIGSAPGSFAAALERQRSHRCWGARRASLGALSARAGATILTPLMETSLMAASAASGGRRGYGGPAAMARAHVGGLLPADALDRPAGASLRHVVVGDQVREFARTWSGGGVDETIVDPVALRAQWATGRVDRRTSSLLQLAWLHDHPVVEPVVHQRVTVAPA